CKAQSSSHSDSYPRSLQDALPISDVILLPAVGTIPGITKNEMVDVVRAIKAKGSLVMSAIGTSQESASMETIRDIALKNKIAGVDRKSTRLNSSHVSSSYAVFCVK